MRLCFIATTIISTLCSHAQRQVDFGFQHRFTTWDNVSVNGFGNSYSWEAQVKSSRCVSFKKSWCLEKHLTLGFGVIWCRDNLSISYYSNDWNSKTPKLNLTTSSFDGTVELTYFQLPVHIGVSLWKRRLQLSCELGIVGFLNQSTKTLTRISTYTIENGKRTALLEQSFQDGIRSWSGYRFTPFNALWSIAMNQSVALLGDDEMSVKLVGGFRVMRGKTNSSTYYPLRVSDWFIGAQLSRFWPKRNSEAN